MQEHDTAAAASTPTRDPFASVVLVLLAGAAAGIIGAIALSYASAIAADAAIVLGIATGALIGVAAARAQRHSPEPAAPAAPETAGVESSTPEVPVASEAHVAAEPSDAEAAPPREKTAADEPAVSPPPSDAGVAPPRRNLVAARPPRPGETLELVGLWFGGVGLIACVLAVIAFDPAKHAVTAASAAFAGGALVVAAGLLAVVARYLRNADAERFREAPALTRAARTIAWMFILLAAATAAALAHVTAAQRAIHYVVLVVTGVACIELVRASWPGRGVRGRFPIDLVVTAVLGSRPNVVASVLDACQQRLGIDLRSTWALTVARRSILPLVLGLAVLGWLTTGITIVHSDEQALIQRLGVPVDGPPMPPGIHVHYPWPIDRVIRIQMQKVRSLTVGHEGEEENGPEDVLWARQHAKNEYTLLLGNGRDLITVDAQVQYRVRDARAWTYNSQNPADALRAIAYRAVMRTTVDRTLEDALSENVAMLTKRIREIVQHDADELGLGVEVVGFTLGGMHPPVAVAADYQSVVSAELGKVTAVVTAHTYHDQTVPAAEIAALTATNAAHGEGTRDLAQAAGEAWSFRTLESQYNASHQEYRFRRRLETLERALASRRFTIVDARIMRDGGALWLAE